MANWSYGQIIYVTIFILSWGAGNLILKKIDRNHDQITYTVLYTFGWCLGSLVTKILVK